MKKPVQAKCGRALLVEDDPFSREAMSGYLEDWGFEVMAVGTYEAAVAVLQLESSDALKLAVVDISLPKNAIDQTWPRSPNGILLLRDIKERYPECGVMMWTAHIHFLADMAKLISSGYYGLTYVPKGSSFSIIEESIKRVLAGDVFMPRHAFVGTVSLLSEQLLGCFPGDAVSVVLAVSERLGDLSKREMDVASRFLRTAQAIADDLGIRVRTVRNYQDTIFEKLGLRDPEFGADTMRRDVVIALAVLIQQLNDE